MLQDKPRCTDLSPLHTRILRFHLTSGKRNSYLAPRDISFFLLRLELAFFYQKTRNYKANRLTFAYMVGSAAILLCNHSFIESCCNVMWDCNGR